MKIEQGLSFYSVWAQGTALYGRWAASQGISYTELSIMYALATTGDTTQKIICEQYGLPKQTVNACIHQLEKKGYLQLAPGKKDKREKTVAFTSQGEQTCLKTLSSLFEIEAYICRNISQEKMMQAIETRALYNTLFEKGMERSLAK